MDIITDIIRGFIGISILIGICYLLSSDRKSIDWKLVIGGIILQLILGVLILKIPFVYAIFQWVSDRFVDLLSFSEKGAEFVFGKWPDEAYIESMDYSSGERVIYKLGYMFAFKVLPTVVFFSAFSALLYYFGILQRIIYVFAYVMSKFMKLSGAESIAAAANVFIGQTEAPLVVKPYLEKMTRSEIMCLMVGGFATIAGGVFALFVSMIGPDSAIHFLTASIISAPAAIIVAKILLPEKVHVDRAIEIPKEKLGSNVLDAIAIGTKDGVKLAVNVGAMLLVFIALVAFANSVLGWLGDITQLNEKIIATTSGRFEGLSIEYILGIIFSPIAYIIGVPWEESMLVGQLLGKKMAINEVIAYADLQYMLNPDNGIILSEKAKIISMYALCGFANFSSIGIQIGGISAIAPNKRLDLTELGVKAMIGGTIATLLTGAIAGFLV